MLYAAARAKWNVAELISCVGAASNEMMSAPATAAAANSIAKNRRPLPKNTVAKNLSSRSPRRSRNTPMNHRNAIPATARATELDSDLSHDPGSCGSSGTEILKSQNTRIRLFVPHLFGRQFLKMAAVRHNAATNQINSYDAALTAP